MRSLLARAGLIALIGIRSLGLGPHVRSTATGPLTAAEAAELWSQPTDLAARDLFYGAGGAGAAPDPQAGYVRIGQKTSGFSPGYDVKGQDGTEWSVKEGPEAQAEVVASRLLWAAGFHQPPTYYLPHWTLVTGSTSTVQPEARFRPKGKGLHSSGSWSWRHNQFVDSGPYRGLIVLMMLLNSTDLRNENNVVYDLDTEREGARTWYVVRDLGATLGETGVYRPRRNYLDGFERQGFLDGVHDGQVRFEFHGLQKELTHNISTTDTRWACGLLDRLSPEQWRDAFRAAGYPPETADRYIRKLDAKIAEGLALPPASPVAR